MKHKRLLFLFFSVILLFGATASYFLWLRFGYSYLRVAAALELQPLERVSQDGHIQFRMIVLPAFHPEFDVTVRSNGSQTVIEVDRLDKLLWAYVSWNRLAT